MSSPLPLLRPAWDAPADVGAAMSQRRGGVSQGPYAGLNLGMAVGDDPAAVAENRARFAAGLGARPVWLRQVHGVNVLRLHADSPDAPDEPADAAFTTAMGVACTVQAADCMPVLMALRDGSAVAAAHAGWRGLAAGVLENTVRALCGAGQAAPEVGQAAVGGAAPADVLVWLGPCIGPRAFEVGVEVLQAFGEEAAATQGRGFVYRPRPDGAPRWLANLPLLARLRLQAAGVQSISSADTCTVEEASCFFSFRRDGVTGRMAAAIWRQ